MNTEISKDAIQNQLKRIIESHTFSRSDANQRLLIYLVNTTLKGENPKEYTIGVDVFNRPADEVSNSNVRVYVHKLRKKLAKYYEDEGINDPVLFTIPSGTYTLSFSKRKKEVNNRRVPYIIIAGLILSNLLVFSYFQFRRTPLQKLASSVFWGDLLTNNKPTVLIAGDYFFFNKKIEGHTFVNIRDPRINSEQELRTYIDSNQLVLSKYRVLRDVAYMPRDALFSIPEILPVFYENKLNYELLLSTDFDWKIFKGSNLVYIGSMKNLRALNSVFDRLNLQYDKQSERLIFNDGEKTRTFDLQYEEKKSVDIAAVIRIPGPENNIIHLFVSNHEIGCMATTKLFSNPEKLAGFEKKYLQESPYFVSIFKAEGIARTDLSAELIEFKAIKDTMLEQIWHY